MKEIRLHIVSNHLHLLYQRPVHTARLVPDAPTLPRLFSLTFFQSPRSGGSLIKVKHAQVARYLCTRSVNSRLVAMIPICTSFYPLMGCRFLRTVELVCRKCLDLHRLASSRAHPTYQGQILEVCSGRTYSRMTLTSRPASSFSSRPTASPTTPSYTPANSIAHHKEAEEEEEHASARVLYDFTPTSAYELRVSGKSASHPARFRLNCV